MKATYGTNGTRYPLRAYDEWGFGGGLEFVYVETMGPVGIVRARTWEDAYEVCDDVIFDDADPKDPCNFARDYDPTAEEGEPAEGCGYRPNGPANNCGLSSPMYATDLNGSYLYATGSPEGRRIMEEWGIVVEYEEDTAEMNA